MIAEIINRLLKQFGYRMTKTAHSGPNTITDLPFTSDANFPLVVLDVGANRGQTIEKFLKKYPNASLISVEPDPDCYAHLNANHGASDQVKLFNCALSDEEGNTVLYLNSRSDLNSLAPLTQSFESRFGKNTGKVDVECSTIDAILARANQNHINVLKIDVQGFECEVLRGAENAIGKSLFDWIVVEITFSNMYQTKTQFFEIQRYLSANYHLYTIFDIAYTDGFALNQCDFVYCKKELVSESNTKTI